jgi:predicted  nucleic acid-binding Zn-ribbon protein
MGLFTPNATSERFDALMEELAGLKRQVAELKGDREGHGRAQKLESEIAKLKRDLTDKQIDYDREHERWEREKREVEHMVGLQRKRSEYENEAATREAKLVVREENLTAQQERFDEHVAFIEKRFDQQFRSLEKLTGQILERMPTTRQLISVGGSRNGRDDEEE